MRYLFSFKTSDFKKFKTSLEDLKKKKKDTEQINGYITGLTEEYPEAQISQFVIYCFGNQGFRVFAV